MKNDLTLRQNFGLLECLCKCRGCAQQGKGTIRAVLLILSLGVALMMRAVFEAGSMVELILAAA